MPSDVDFMNRCLELAHQGHGRVGNGAMVGAVLVRGGVILAEGFHEAFGKAHAERQLLQTFDAPIEPDDLLYVNLEPCCHHGKTPPCTQILIERGVKHVIYGMRDPDPRVAGRGMEELRRSGIDVRQGGNIALCERLNRGFISVRTKGRPWITLKMAQMKDGRTASRDGTRLMITSEEQNVWSHTHLRSELDAILAGVGTINADDPSLNTRLAQRKTEKLNTKSDQLNPYRVVLDPTLRIKETSKVLTDEFAYKTILITSDNASDATKRTLVDGGVRIFTVGYEDGVFNLDDLWRVLTTPDGDFHGLTSILVEGGAKTWQIFREAGVVDEEVTLVGRG